MDKKILINDFKIAVIGSIIAIVVYLMDKNITHTGYVIGTTLMGIGVYHISILIKYINEYKEEITEDENENN